ncbi:MAG: hypothetical protein IAG13_23285 [Deltaproteobacteria bacterium]|nr:hypothetical protein [Nannocystaceae bacterium]
MTEGDWERRIERLERTVAALEREVNARQGFAATMRVTGQCRACGSLRIWRARELRLGSTGEVLAMHYTTWGNSKARFEADVCATCGVVELTVVDLDAIEEKKPNELRVGPELELPPGVDPFRSGDE